MKAITNVVLISSNQDYEDTDDTVVLITLSKTAICQGTVTMPKIDWGQKAMLRAYRFQRQMYTSLWGTVARSNIPTSSRFQPKGIPGRQYWPAEHGNVVLLRPGRSGTIRRGSA